MRTKAEIQTAIAEKELAIVGAKTIKEESEKKAEKIRKQIDELISNNPTAKERKKYEDRRDGLRFWGIALVVGPIILDIILFVTLLVSEPIIEAIIDKDALQLQLTILSIPPILIVPGIIMFISSFFFKGKIKNLTDKLLDFDKEKAPLEKSLAEFENIIENSKKTLKKEEELLEKYKTELDEVLEKNRIESKYAAYAKNYVLIFVAEEGSSSKDFRNIRHEITIDGISYGAASRPFKAIELSEGPHAVRVDVGLTIGGDFCIYTADVEQVRVSENSVFLKYVFKGPSMPFRAEKHYDAFSFFKATNQKS